MSGEAGLPEMVSVVPQAAPRQEIAAGQQPAGQPVAAPAQASAAVQAPPGSELSEMAHVTWPSAPPGVVQRIVAASLTPSPAPAAARAAPAAPEEAAPIAVGYAGATPTTPAAAVLANPAPAHTPRKIAARSPELDALIAKYALIHDIPLELLRRVVNRESTFNPAARNGPYWGLMQIHPQTARTMGYNGPPEGLLDAETNLIYAGKYLRGAYITAGGNHDQAVRFYSRGYYYDAKRLGLLRETGLRS